MGERQPVMQHLYETFYKLKPKRLGQPGKKYKICSSFSRTAPAILKCARMTTDAAFTDSSGMR
jgi:hypothetical protein